MSRLTRIHVNQHTLRRNKKTGERSPVIGVMSSKHKEYGNRVEILDDKGAVVARVIYSPDKPLRCGAHCWIETRKLVRISPRTQQQTKGRTEE